MKGLNLWLLACAAVLAVGCGGGVDTVVEEDGELLTSTGAAMICTAYCGPGVTEASCTFHETCEANPRVGVTCDGRFYPCPSCQYIQCRSRIGRACYPERLEAPCCNGTTEEATCVCLGGVWNCY